MWMIGFAIAAMTWIGSFIAHGCFYIKILCSAVARVAFQDLKNWEATTSNLLVFFVNVREMIKKDFVKKKIYLRGATP